MLTQAALGFAALMVAAAPTAPPAAPCGPAHSVLEALHVKYHESIRWIGHSSSGFQDILTAAPGGKTWTLLALMHLPGGTVVACTLDSGGALRGEGGA